MKFKERSGGGEVLYFLVVGLWECAAGWGRIFTAGLTILDYDGVAFSSELLEWDRTF